MLRTSPDALTQALIAARARAAARRQQQDPRHRNDVPPGQMMGETGGPQVWTNHTANYWPTDGDYS